jgi:hypothetical protein
MCGVLYCVSFLNMCTCIYCFSCCLYYVFCIVSFMYVFVLVLSVLPPSDNLIAVSSSSSSSRS